MKKRIFVLLMLLCLILTLTVPAWADDGDRADFSDYIDYTGTLDPVTGLPSGAQTDSGTNLPDSGKVSISSNLYYSYDNHMYTTVTAGGEVQSTIPSGFVTTDEVKIRLQGGISGTLYLDGNEVASGTSFQVKDVGGYVLSIPTTGGQSIEPMKFFVVREMNGLKQYDLPEGFAFSEVLCDGDPVNFASGRLDLDREGTYLIKVSCPASGMTHSMTLRVDHTAPVLALEAVVDGVADGPVDISDLEPGAAIRIERNGQYMDYEKELTSSGEYHIIVEDEAGNRSEYLFEIAVYFNSSAWIFLLLLAALIAGLVIYLIIVRRKLRIR